jgi:hypothetical protein
MKNLKYSQNGLTAVKALIIVAILGIIGGVGYYVHNSQNKVNKNDSQTANSSAAPSTNGPAVNYKSPEKYLVINEWGVKVPLGGDDIGAYYSYNSSASLHNPLYDSVSIFDKSIDDAKNDDGTSCKNPNYPLFVISRAKSGDVNSLKDSKNPNFIGETAPVNFQAYSFAKDYEFAGSSLPQSTPPCVSQKSGKVNSALLVQYQKTIKALTNSYSYIRAE